MSRITLIISLLAAVCLAGTGCGPKEPSNDDVAKQFKAGPPKRTPEEMAKTTARMQQFKNQSKSERDQWMANNPDKVAEVNAKRAAAGFPPLGQEGSTKH